MSHNVFAHLSHNLFDVHICAIDLDLYLYNFCKFRPLISVHWKFQERRMGHGKSRPLRNMSKKKGFRLFQILFGPVSRMIFTTISSKVENACLGVFAGKACVWWVYELVLHPRSYIPRHKCMQCISFIDPIFKFQVSVVFAILGLLAGVAIYMDPEVGIQHLHNTCS